MEKLSSIVAAVDAGKLPTQQQTNQYIDYVLKHFVAPLEADDSLRLSVEGKIIAQDVREVLLAYKQLSTNKNYDDVLQETLCHLEESNFSEAHLQPMDVDETRTDIDAFRSAIRTLIKILWANITGEGTALLNDFASFSRLAIADLAEVVESQAAYAKESLRQIDTEGDEEYKRALSTLFDTTAKWVNKTVDTVADVGPSTSLETFVDDPTDEKHLHQALYNIRALVERLADGKSLDGVISHFRACALDVKEDKDIKAWYNDFFAYVRKCLEEPKYAHDEQAKQEYEHLSKRWNELLDEDSDAARKWKQDVKALRRDLRAFQQAISKDPDVIRVRKSHTQLCGDLESIGVDTGKAGVRFALEQGSWFWQDVFNVYVPRVLNALKDIPIPRTEYVDSEVEFVLENLDISSLHLLPGHVYIRNITDVDISAPAEGTTQTAWGTLTHIRLQAMQLMLSEVSFYYKDKTATVGPSEFTGIMEFDLPTQGLDVDFKFRLIPNTALGIKERERRGRFFIVERVDVHLAKDITFKVKQSNHPILASVFKAVLVARFREALERTIEEQIRGLFDVTDYLSFDVSKRADVFEDAGLSRGAAIVAGLWSEIGRLRRMEGGLLSGWKATGTGIVKEGLPAEGTLAMGAEPQILPGEKRGPLGTFSVPLTERKEVEGVVEVGRSVTEQVKETAHESVRQVQTFKETVRKKALEERRRPGWQS
ncbi:hypothetical protein ID866_7618, partial [Astraeus odoratus]